MSHAEYCAKLDEDQLDSLIEHARSRQDALKSEGWVSVWVVADHCNRAWFPIDKREEAVSKMIDLIQQARKNPGPIEFSVQQDRMRPSEAAVLFERES